MVNNGSTIITRTARLGQNFAVYGTKVFSSGESNSLKLRVISLPLPNERIFIGSFGGTKPNNISDDRWQNAIGFDSTSIRISENGSIIQTGINISVGDIIEVLILPTNVVTYRHNNVLIRTAPSQIVFNDSTAGVFISQVGAEAQVSLNDEPIVPSKNVGADISYTQTIKSDIILSKAIPNTLIDIILLKPTTNTFTTDIILFIDEPDYFPINYNDINYFTENPNIKPSFDILLIKKDNQLSIKTDLVLIKSTPLNIVIDILLPPSELEILCDSILIKKDNQLPQKIDVKLVNVNDTEFTIDLSLVNKVLNEFKTDIVTKSIPILPFKIDIVNRKPNTIQTFIIDFAPAFSIINRDSAYIRRLTENSSNIRRLLGGISNIRLSLESRPNIRRSLSDRVYIRRIKSDRSYIQP